MSVKKAANPDEISFKQLTPPMIMESVLRVTVGVVNAAFLSNISRSAVSAVNVSTQYINMCQIIATAIATGTIVCLNQAVGMKNQKNINKYAAVAFFSNVVMGLFFGLLFFLFSRPMLSIMTFETEELRNMAVNYMRVVGTSMVFQAAQIVMSNINRSTGHTKAPLFTNLVINAVNILGCYLVVNGHIFKLWHPMIGVAVSNVISQIFGLAVAAFILSRSYVQLSIKNIIPFPWKDFKLALSIGIPAGMNNMAYSASQLVTTSIISQTSQLMFDAKNYISSVVGYVALVGMAFAQSATILIGYRIGAGDFDGAKALRKKVMRISAISNAFFSLILIFAYKPIFNALYGGSAGFEEILPIAGIIVIIDFVVEQGRGMNVVLGGALQATGDVTYQLIVNQASGWIIAVGGAYLFGVVLGFELYGIWFAFAIDEMTRALILVRRWNKGKWEAKARLRTKTIAE